MKEIKAIAVTVAMTAMLVTITVCLALLGYKVAVGTIVGVLAAIGLCVSALSLCQWLSAEKETEELAPAPIVVGEDADPVISSTVDEIIEETRNMA